MRVRKMNNDRIEEFVQYCKSYRGQVDDSFLYDEDLRDFTPDEENPTYILLNEQGIIIGAISLIIDSYNRKGKKARIRIFHSMYRNRESYSMLLEAALNEIEGIDKLYNFVNEDNSEVIKIIKSLGFEIERYSYCLAREKEDIAEVIFPKEYELRTLQFGWDEEDWCVVRNAGFEKLAGSEIPITPDWVSSLEGDELILEDGMKLLYHKEKPVGQVAMSREITEDKLYTFIFSLCVIPEYQGKGLGRKLLRAAINFGKSKGMPQSMLSVNAENENALRLYFQEGFKKIETMGCYNYRITDFN
ncbi:GNAT family N-acetyltransferase [Oceanirhabdus sp. W0125-5]|uniref:GNAT family N-acetyltransferase n=1 Tax=Oceanirhabdus sp. W0125-5 TaxID=2999116 RepID=UPI0022F342C7|nr:GNAT family N-acetyltransferase [Oceanirhabdus sp. W0125-5]WBW94699.1 GNAT family N-acetyltransferase [Oceanirhabdus sp. W0125-5]